MTKLVDEAWAGRVIGRADAEMLRNILQRKNYRSESIFWIAVKRCDEINVETPELAVEVAKELCKLGKSLDESLFAMALSVLGSAHRALAQYDKSRGAYVRALSIPTSRDIQGKILQRLAVLEWTLTNWKEAREAVDASLELLDGVDAAISLVVRSKVLLFDGEPIEAARDAGMALKVLDPKTHEQAYVSAIQSVIYMVIDGAPYSKDLIEMAQFIRGLKRSNSRRKKKSSVCWLYVDFMEALIFARLGSHRQAERQLLRVRDRLFEAGGDHFRQALIVSIDLAVLYEDCGEFWKSKNVAEEALSIAECYGFTIEASTIKAYTGRRWLRGVEKELRGATPRNQRGT